MGLRAILFVIYLGASQVCSGVCIEIDCSASIEKAVEEVNDAIDESTSESKKSLEKLYDELKNLDTLQKEKNKALDEREKQLIQYNTTLTKLIEAFKVNNSYKQELLNIKANRLFNKGKNR